MKLRTRPVLLWGLGGTGKTRLVIEYAQHQRKRFSGGVYGITAATDWDSQLRSIAQSLGLPADNAREIGPTLEKFFNDHPRTLLIIDDVVDPKTLGSDQNLGIKIAGLRCRVVVIARRTTEGRRYQVRKVNSLPEAEALKLLLSASNHQDLPNHAEPGTAAGRLELNAARDTCVLLGNLPLAITIAAAYLSHFGSITLHEYRERLQAESRLQAVDSALDDLPVDPDFDRTLSATLMLQWEALKNDDARHLLKALALLDKTDWLSCAQIGLLAGLRNKAALPGYPSPLEAAIRSVRSFALIEERMMAQPTDPSSPHGTVSQEEPLSDLPDYVRLHSLVRAFVREKIITSAGEGRLREQLKAHLLATLNAVAPLEERRQAALLLADLQWLGEVWLSLPTKAMLDYMELVVRYLDTDEERRYLEVCLNLVLDQPTRIELPQHTRAQLLVYRAGLRGELGHAGQAADDYLAAERLVSEIDPQLAARIELGLANLIRIEYQQRLDQAVKPETRQEAEAGLRIALTVYKKADEFALRYGQDPILQARIQQQLAYTYALVADWTAAEQSYQMVQAWIDRIEDKGARTIHLAQAQETWSQVHFERGKFLQSQNDPGACAAFNTAYDIVADEIRGLKEAGLEDYDYVLAQYNAGEILLYEARCPDCRKPRLREARAYFEKALELARRLEFDNIVSDTEKILRAMETAPSETRGPA